MQDFDNNRRSQNNWRTDESDLVNVLVDVMRQHHVNDKGRIRNFLRWIVRRPRR